MAGELRLSLLGTPQIVLEEGELNGRLPLKSLVILYYLVCNNQVYSRSKIAGMLWGRKTEDFARRNLRVALPKFRNFLNPYITITYQTMTFNWDADYWLDVESFEYALQRANGVEGAARRAILREAVALYRGDFLEGIVIDGESIYEEWILPERERLRQLMLDALDQLVAICIEQGDYEAGIQYAKQLLRLDEWREDAHRQLMQMYARNGQRTLALKQFDKCHDVLDEEFGLPPTEATLALYQQILAMEEGQVYQPLPPLIEEADGAPFLAPKQVPHFLGRDIELAQLREDLQTRSKYQIYCLIGMGGAGKTALAIELAHEMRDKFPDGVLWVNATTADPMTMAERWANAYGYDFSRIPELDERAAVLRNLLAEKQALLIFDDVTSAAKIRPFLPENGSCAVLITTRFADIVHTLKAQALIVSELTPVNGHSLLSSIIGEDRIAAEEAAATEICQLLQGLPLAISIVGQRLALRTQRKLAAFTDRLRHETERIGLEDENRAIRASFAISWEGLDETQRRVFAQTAVFAGRAFHIAAMAAVIEMEQYPAQDRLDELVALSLLNEEADGWYRQHALLAIFAREKLGEGDATFQRMVAYYHAFVYRFKDDFAELGPEWENLAVSIAQAHRLRLWKMVIAFTEALRDAWFMRGRYFEARQAFQQAAEAAKALDDQQALAQCLRDWGYVCLEQNDLDEARDLLLQSLAFYEERGDLTGKARVQVHLARIAKINADYDEAVRLLVASRRLHEQTGDKAGFAETIYWEAHVKYSYGDYDDAKKMYEQALELQESLDDKLGVLRTLRSLIASGLNPDLALKKKILQRANKLADALHDQVERSIILREMFTLFWEEGKLQKAEEFAYKSLNLFRNMGDRRGQAMGYFLLSEFKQQQQNTYDDALKNSQRSLEICRALKDKPGTAFSLKRLGDVYKCLFQNQQACQSWREAFEIASQLKHKKLLGELSDRLQDCPGEPSSQ